MSENEREDIGALKYQLREWWNKVVKRHLPQTDCDRDNPQAVSDVLANLKEENEKLKADIELFHLETGA